MQSGQFEKHLFHKCFSGVLEGMCSCRKTFVSQMFSGVLESSVYVEEGGVRMIFKCKNCGGNSVYSPETKKMHCPHCESEDSQEKVAGVGLSQCGNCGAPLEAGDYTSAMKCPSCGSYHVFEERIDGEYTPHLILPFQVSKKQAVEILRKEFGKRIFTPASFLSNASVSKMEGTYVPFFLYDFHSNIRYSAKGTKVRTWTRGDMRYKETSYFAIERDMDAEFEQIPVDASTMLDNTTMDLLEPYDYKALENFQDKYMSGFQGEIYSDNADALRLRAENKAEADSNAMVRESVSGYATVTEEREQINLQQKKCEYALLPVWIYDFNFQGETYRFHVNGQTGKVIGKTPVAYGKVVGYSATVFALITAAGFLLRTLLLAL